MSLDVKERIKELQKNGYNGAEIARILRDDKCPIADVRNGFLKRGLIAVVDNEKTPKHLSVSDYPKTTMDLDVRRTNGRGLTEIPWF